MMALLSFSIHILQLLILSSLLEPSSVSASGKVCAEDHTASLCWMCKESALMECILAAPKLDDARNFPDLRDQVKHSCQAGAAYAKCWSAGVCCAEFCPSLNAAANLCNLATHPTIDVGLYNQLHDEMKHVIYKISVDNSGVDIPKVGLFVKAFGGGTSSSFSSSFSSTITSSSISQVHQKSLTVDHIKKPIEIKEPEKEDKKEQIVSPTDTSHDQSNPQSWMETPFYESNPQTDKMETPFYQSEIQSPSLFTSSSEEPKKNTSLTNNNANNESENKSQSDNTNNETDNTNNETDNTNNETDNTNNDNGNHNNDNDGGLTKASLASYYSKKPQDQSDLLASYQYEDYDDQPTTHHQATVNDQATENCEESDEIKYQRAARSTNSFTKRDLIGRSAKPKKAYHMSIAMNEGIHPKCGKDFQNVQYPTTIPITVQQVWNQGF